MNIRRSLPLLIALTSMSVLAACGGDDDNKTSGAQTGNGNGNGNGGGTETEKGPTLAAVFSARGGATQVALLNADGFTEKNLISSKGNGTLKVNAALSTDVVLGRDTGAPAGQITVIDRTNSVLTVVDTQEKKVLGQLKVAPEDFTSNPYDVAQVDATHAWVTRFNPNPKVTCTEDNTLSCGDDLLEFNPTTLELTGRRVHFDTQEVTAASTSTTTFSRPSSVVAFGDKLAVGLVYANAGYSAHAPGQLGVVDLSQDPPTTSLVQLSDDGSAINCGTIRRSGESSVLVSCWGNFVDKNKTGGVYQVDLSKSPAEVKALHEPRDAGSVAAVNNAEPIGTPGHFIADASIYGKYDALYYVMPGKDPVEIVTHEKYSGYSVAYEPVSKKVYYSDRTEDTFGIFTLEMGKPAAKVEGSDKIGLPPSHLAPIPQ